MTNQTLPGTAALKPLAEAWINLHIERKTKTATGASTKREELALARWYGAMETAEAFTGIDRYEFVDGTSYEKAYISACIDRDVRASEVWMVVASTIRSLMEDAIISAELAR